jgi:hypothetical protein
MYEPRRAHTIDFEAIAGHASLDGVVVAPFTHSEAGTEEPAPRQVAPEPRQNVRSWPSRGF